jgi:hypothetical protein
MIKPRNDSKCYGCLSLNVPPNVVHQNVCYFYEKRYLGCPCQICLIKGVCNFECDLFRQFVEKPKAIDGEKI